MTVSRVPARSATQPMTTPPEARPIQASELARAGTVRSPPFSAAIVLSATTRIQGAPNASVRTRSTTLATIQDELDSMDCTVF